MNEFLKFKSVGGGTLDVSFAGDYFLPIDNIIAVDGYNVDGNTNIVIWTLTPPDTATTVSYYKLEFNQAVTAAVKEAFFNAIGSKPGGVVTDVQLPAGFSILSWSYNNENIY
tara:strand:+ start:96 stop:431 length:336 start_codon:yes stop_codon:yes gene_type:complete